MRVTNVLRMIRTMAGGGSVASFRDVAEQEMMRLSNLLPAGENSAERLNTAPPGRGVNNMIKIMPIRKRIKLVPTLLRTMDTVTECGDFMHHKITPSRSEGNQDILNAVYQLAKDMGATDIAYVKIPPDEVFQDMAIPYENAFVYTMEMDKDVIDTAPSHDALIEVLSTYSSLGEVAISLTKHLRDEGFGAYPGFPIGGMVDYVRVAELAGIGAIGYHGMLISPDNGTRQRINIVYTNMDIPQPQAKMHEWILDFCAMCNKCVRDCPPQAIYTDGEVNPVTGRKKTLDYDKCLDYYGSHNGCAVCVKTCPFSQAGYDVIQTRFIGTKEEEAVS